jgi:hypothetical protein
MFQTMLGFARRHIILFGVAKFSVGVFVGFVFGIYFLPVLIAQDGLDQATLAELQSKFSVAVNFAVILPARTVFTGVRDG